MSELPDKEKVIKELESLRDICNAKSNMAIGKGKVAWAGYANAAEDALELLKEQEARIEQLKRFVNGFSREAVPVVRCKDCKNGGMDSTSYPHYWCTRHAKYVRENYFCADGESREGR